MIVIRYKIDVLEALKKRGFTTYKLRHDKLISDSTVSKLRKSEMIGLKTIDQLCKLLRCDVGDIIQYVEGD